MSAPKIAGFPDQRIPSRYSKNVSEAGFAIEELSQNPFPQCHAYPRGNKRCDHLCKLDPDKLAEARNIALNTSLPYNYHRAVEVYHALLCDTHSVKASFCLPLVFGLMGISMDEASSPSSDQDLRLILRPEDPEDGPPLADVINYCNEEIQRTEYSSGNTNWRMTTSAALRGRAAASTGTQSPTLSEPSQITRLAGSDQDCKGEPTLDFIVTNFELCFGDGKTFNCIAYSSTGERCKHNLGTHGVETARNKLKRDFGRPPLLSVLEPLILELLCADHRTEHWKDAYYLKWSPSFVGGFHAQPSGGFDHTVTDGIGQESIRTPVSFEPIPTEFRATKSPSPATLGRQPHRSCEGHKVTKNTRSDMRCLQCKGESRATWSEIFDQKPSTLTAALQYTPHLPEATVYEDTPATTATTATATVPQTPKKSPIPRTASSYSPLPSRPIPSPSQGPGLETAWTQDPSIYFGSKYTPVKAPAQLERFGFMTRFELLEDPKTQDILSNDSRELLSDLKKIGTSEEVIPQDLKYFAQAHPLGRNLQSKHFTPAGPPQRNTSWDSIQAAMTQWHRIHELLEASWECEKADLFESAWNAEVHSVVLRLALQGERRKETGIWYRDVTTASISHCCLPSPVPGNTRQVSKMVDYAMVIEPPPVLAGAIYGKLRRRGECSINHTDQSHLLKTPIAVGIETKRPGCDEFTPRAQLTVWAAAHFSRLHQLAQTAGQETCAKDIIEIPLILVQGHEWKLALAKAEVPDEHKICFMRYIAIGKTNSILGIYTLIASLQRLGKWASEVYEPWFKLYVLGLED